MDKSSELPPQVRVASVALCASPKCLSPTCPSPRLGKHDDPMLQWRDPVHEQPLSPASSSSSNSYVKGAMAFTDAQSLKRKSLLSFLDYRTATTTTADSRREELVARSHSHTMPTQHGRVLRSSLEELEEAKRLASNQRMRTRGPSASGSVLQSLTHEALQQLAAQKPRTSVSG